MPLLILIVSEIFLYLVGVTNDNISFSWKECWKDPYRQRSENSLLRDKGFQHVEDWQIAVGKYQRACLQNSPRTPVDKCAYVSS